MNNNIKEMINQYQIPVLKLKNKLRNTDYLAIKYAEGLIHPMVYEQTKQYRQNLRDEINRIEESYPVELLEFLKSAESDIQNSRGKHYE